MHGVMFSWIFREPETVPLDSSWAAKFFLMGISTQESEWIKYQYSRLLPVWSFYQKDPAFPGRIPEYYNF